MGTMRDVPIAEIALPPQPRDYHGVNWEGLKTLYIREIQRFWKVGMQTLAAPVVTALLYMLVFVVAVGGGREVREGLAGELAGRAVRHHAGQREIGMADDEAQQFAGHVTRAAEHDGGNLFVHSVYWVMWAVTRWPRVVHGPASARPS